MIITGECLELPTDKAICKWGSSICPKEGYWRNFNTIDNFIKWLYYHSWLGIITPNNNPTDYQGILWPDWKTGYSRTGEYQWTKWPEKLWNILRILFVLAVALIVVFIITKSTLDGALVRKNLQSIYFKILMNHLQLIFLSASFDFDWPSNVEGFFDIIKPTSQVSTQILSFDWFMDDRLESDDTEQASDLYFTKLIMFALLPLVLIIGSLIFWTVFYMCKDRAERSKAKVRVIATIVILLFLTHPSIVKLMFKSFNCMEIDNERRMTDDLNVVW